MNGLVNQLTSVKICSSPITMPQDLYKLIFAVIPDFSYFVRNCIRWYTIGVGRRCLSEAFDTMVCCIRKYIKCLVVMFTYMVSSVMQENPNANHNHICMYWILDKVLYENFLIVHFSCDNRNSCMFPCWYSLLPIGHVALVAITGTTILVPYI